MLLTPNSRWLNPCMSWFAAAVERGFGAAYGPAERAAIESLVDRLADTLVTAGIGERQTLAACEDWAECMAESPVRAKLELAENLDRDLTNGDPAIGGILDRALDEVIAVLEPYARQSMGWYKSHGLDEES